MATIPLIATGAIYDDVAKRVSLAFVDSIPPGHPDPVNFRSTITVTLVLPPGQIDVKPIAGPETLDAEEPVKKPKSDKTSEG